jgi:hypothetical protein
MDNLVNTAKESVPSMPTGENIQQGITNAASAMKDTVSGTMNDFSSKNVMNASNEFLESNGMVAKFAFIILIVIVFVLLLNLGMWALSAFLEPSRSPYIVNGLINGQQPMMVSQDPSNKKSVVIYRSNDQNGGMEFTWGFWIQVLALPSDNKHKAIFVKGSAPDTNAYDDNTGLVKVNNGPGVYIMKKAAGEGAAGTGNQCVMHFEMNVVNPDNSPTNSGQTQNKTLDVPNFPIGKWAHVAFRLQNKILDCYVNGTVTSRVNFDDKIPKQNYDNIYLCGNGGFPGNLSNLRYYDYALSVFEINSIVYYGPNLNSVGEGNNTRFDFLGLGWYKGNQPT